jgi:hypothetical protein
VVDALGGIRSQEAVDVLRAALNDAEPRVRIHAEASLIKLNAAGPASEILSQLVTFIGANRDLKSFVRSQWTDVDDAVRTLASRLNIEGGLLNSAIIALDVPVGSRVSGHGTYNTYYAQVLDMNEGLNAVKKLCSIDSEFTSAVLKLVSTRQNTTIELHSDCSGSHTETADFSQWRQLARQELIRRGILA